LIGSGDDRRVHNVERFARSNGKGVKSMKVPEKQPRHLSHRGTLRTLALAAALVCLAACAPATPPAPSSAPAAKPTDVAKPAEAAKPAAPAPSPAAASKPAEPPAGQPAAKTNAAAVDPCGLLSKAEVAEQFGEIKEGPKPKTALGSASACEFTNTDGGVLTITVDSADKWGLRKGSAIDPKSESGLGEEAFSVPRSTGGSDLAVKKSSVFFEIEGSINLDKAKAIATKALVKL
jgi:hypothetical protein